MKSFGLKFASILLDVTPMKIQSFWAEVQFHVKSCLRLKSQLKNIQLEHLKLVSGVFSQTPSMI